MTGPTKKFVILTLVLIMVSATVTLACAGRGNGPMGGQGNGGWGTRNQYANLTDEQITDLQQIQETFFQETRDLRSNLYQKRLALAAELAKKTPDMEKAKALQADFSELKGQMAQKQLAHRLELKKKFPDLDTQSFGRGKGRGNNFGNRGGNFNNQGWGNNTCPGCGY